MNLKIDNVAEIIFHDVYLCWEIDFSEVDLLHLQKSIFYKSSFKYIFLLELYWTFNIQFDLIGL